MFSTDFGQETWILLFVFQNELCLLCFLNHGFCRWNPFALELRKVCIAKRFYLTKIWHNFPRNGEFSLKFSGNMFFGTRKRLVTSDLGNFEVSNHWWRHPPPKLAQNTPKYTKSAITSSKMAILDWNFQGIYFLGWGSQWFHQILEILKFRITDDVIQPQN